MIEGTGVDLVKISRIEGILERRGDKFLKRVFTPGEIKYCNGCKFPVRHLAARFAAKEAFLKALGTGLSEKLSWLEIEVMSDRKKPVLNLKGNALSKLEHAQRTHLSISHDGEYAIAYVIIER